MTNEIKTHYIVFLKLDVNKTLYGFLKYDI